MKNNVPSILIIDDEGDICFLLKKALQDTGYEIEHVNTLAQAEVFLREQKPEIVFLDNHLPDGSGIENVKTFKDDYPNMKVVLITGYDGWNDKKRALSNGADMYLPKPFTSLQIHEAIDTLINQEA